MFKFNDISDKDDGFDPQEHQLNPKNFLNYEEQQKKYMSLI